MQRPETTLFMLMSLDGKISTGKADMRDVDKDFPLIPGVREGLSQYYDLEQNTDLWSFNTGRVLEKVGVNERKPFQSGVPVTFVVVDNSPHLTKSGVLHLADKTAGLLVITTNSTHPAITMAKSNPKITVLEYQGEIDFTDAFDKLGARGCTHLTIQSGSTMNAHLLRSGLVDKVSIVVSPALIGGTDTASLIGGPSLVSDQDLDKIRALKLISCQKLSDSYLHLKYSVLN